MSSPAGVGDIAARYQRALTADETRVLDAAIQDSYAILLAADPTIDERWPTSPVLMALVVQVQAAMIIRVLRNPDGKLEESIDDYRYRLDSAVSTGALYVSAAELALLAGRKRRGAFSIVLSS